MTSNDDKPRRPPKVRITDQRPEVRDLSEMKAGDHKKPEIPRSGRFWTWAKKTAAGNNKLGQGLGVIKDVALSFTPLGDRITKATGNVTSALEAGQQGESPETVNLSKRQIFILRIIGIGVVGAGLACGILGPRAFLELLLAILT